MTQSVYTFKGVSRIFRDNLSENLLGGTLEFCKWAALEVGGYQNIPLELSGIYGGNRSQLRPAYDPRYTNGQVWEGFRSDWVWESGVSCTPPPIPISGVYINNSFHPVSGTDYYIDYPNGRVIFNSAISTSAVVKTSFSHRTVNFISSDNIPISDILFGSYHVENTDFLTAASGSRSQLGDLKRQLPLVALQINTGKNYEPYEIGGGQYVVTNGTFYVLAESEPDKTALVDLITLQNEKTYWIPNFAQIKDSGVFPYNYNYRGELVDSPIEYPNLIDNYQWRKVRLEDIAVYDRGDVAYKGGTLHSAIIRAKWTAIMGNI